MYLVFKMIFLRYIFEILFEYIFLKYKLVSNILQLSKKDPMDLKVRKRKEKATGKGTKK